MSYTILTIPFNLKEKSGNKYLGNGFVIDDILPEFFESIESANPFLHIATFNPEVIKKVAINQFVELNFPNSNLSKQINEKTIFSSSSFFDSKHLKIAHSYINKTDFNELNKKIVTQTKEPNSIPYKAICPRYIYKKETEGSENPAFAYFEIDEIKIYLNKSNLTKNSICYGFFQIVLKWDFTNAKIMIDNLTSISELFRYYGDENQNKFELCWNNERINEEIRQIEQRNQSGKVPEKNIEINNQKIEEYKKLLLNNNPKKLDFKLLIDKLLEQFIPSKNIDEIFNFEKGLKIKPYILHLSNFQAANESKTLDFESKEVIRSIYRMIRVAGSENIEINKSSNLNFVSPDLYSQQFIINEGAIVIEGTPNSSDLLNKYYPAFLFALNQKYLFHYIQQKINELHWDETSNKYKTEDLKELQETMIYAEFSQIFTSLSNYNEIDYFFEKLREQFKIKDLKKEFLDSINGISKITQIKEREDNELRLRKEEENRKGQEKAEKERRKEEETKRQDEIERSERISEFQSQKLNLVLLLLTIAQVWPNLLSIFLKSEDNRYNLVNIIFYSSIILIGLLFYFIVIPLRSENKLTRKDLILKLKSFLFFTNKE